MKNTDINRRTLLKAALTLPLAATTTTNINTSHAQAVNAAAARPAPGADAGPPVKLSCNLYSFNGPLRDKKMSLDEVLEFCAKLGFDAVDPTAYYFPNYPELPDDAYLYRIKRRAFQLGLEISGTGVRNDFTLPDAGRRTGEVELVKKWVGFSARLGAPVLRVFAGKGVPAGHTREQVTGWVVGALRECAEYAGRQGVMIVLQNHADFIETDDHVLSILRAVGSEWLAVNLDIGSFRTGDAYAQVARVAPHAATWQIKENMFVGGKEEKTDLSKIMRIVRESGYRGYLPIETLGEGDPRVKVPRFLDEVRKELAASKNS